MITETQRRRTNEQRTETTGKTVARNGDGTGPAGGTKTGESRDVCQA